MVGAMLRGQHLPAAVLEQIVAKTDGIPLFVEEVTKAVLEAGYTDVQEQDVATGPLPALAIPATLHEALLARLDRLGSAKGVAQLELPSGASSLCPAAGCRTTGGRAATAGPGRVSHGGVAVSTRAAPAGRYTFQACPDPGSCLRISAAACVRRQTHQRLVQVLEAQFPR